MATIGTEYNLRNAMALKAPDGSMIPLIDTLTKTEELMPLLPWIPANNGLEHIHGFVTSRPSGNWGRLNKGMTYSKADSKQVTDTVAFLEANLRIDIRMFEMGLTDQAMVRAEQTVQFMSGLRDEMMSKIIYGDVKLASEEFTGVLPRYDALPTDELDYTDPAYNVLNASGSGSDNTSIIIANLSPNGLHCIYPDSGMAGLKITPRGTVPLPVSTTASDGTALYDLTTFQWQAGLSIGDWRNVVAIRNIDWSDLKAGTGADIFGLMMDGMARINDQSNLVIIMHPNVLMELSKQQRFQQEQYNIVGTQGYTQLSTFAGVPIVRSRALLMTESAVS